MREILNFWPMITSLAGLGGIVIVAAALFWLQKRFVRREAHEALKLEVKDLAAGVDNVGRELAKINGRLDTLPSSAEINRILLGLEEVRGSQRQISAVIEGQGKLLARVEHQIDVVDNFLRTVGK